jgi:ABC-type Na+ efflux pump permease subunit
MKNPFSKNAGYKQSSIWLISTFVLGLVLMFVTIEFLRDVLTDWLFQNIRLFLVIGILGIVIMSLINSIRCISRPDFKKHIKWVILGAVPFLVFMILFIGSFNWKNLILSIFD